MLKHRIVFSQKHWNSITKHKTQLRMPLLVPEGLTLQNVITEYHQKDNSLNRPHVKREQCFSCH